MYFYDKVCVISDHGWNMADHTYQWTRRKAAGTLHCLLLPGLCWECHLWVALAPCNGWFRRLLCRQGNRVLHHIRSLTSKYCMSCINFPIHKNPVHYESFLIYFLHPAGTICNASGVLDECGASCTILLALSPRLPFPHLQGLPLLLRQSLGSHWWGWAISIM